MFFGRGLANLQKPFATAPMTWLRKTDERENKLVPALFALPSPVAIHLSIGPGPNLPLSEGRSAKAAQRCRRERCNARHPNNVDSFSLNRRDTSLLLDSSTTSLLQRPALHHSCRSPSARADLSSDKERLGSKRNLAAFPRTHSQITFTGTFSGVAT